MSPSLPVSAAPCGDPAVPSSEAAAHGLEFVRYRLGDGGDAVAVFRRTGVVQTTLPSWEGGGVRTVRGQEVAFSRAALEGRLANLRKYGAAYELSAGVLERWPDLPR